MNPTISALHAAIYADGLTPQVVEQVTENEMYVGYCTPDCCGYSDPKWLIKHIVKTNDGLQTIFFSEGSRLFNKQWSFRKTYTYKPTDNWVEEQNDN